MLEAQHISFGYPGEAQLYEDFTLCVDPGERVALQASSGFGKTTLCRLLAGYETPHTGEVLVDGEPLSSAGVSSVQMVWQHPEQAFDPGMRMRDALCEAGCVSEELLERLGIKEMWLSRFPHELSGGELQRFCFARALSVNPRYLIADEVSTMLDAVTQAEIWRFLLEEVARKRIGMVLVSHSRALTNRVATRVVELDAR